MKKNFLYGVLAAAAMTSMVACSSDDNLTAKGKGGEATVSFSVSAPKVVSTRANTVYGDGIKWYGDGITATHLYYAVYNVKTVEGGKQYTYNAQLSKTETNDFVTLTDKAANISVPLVRGQKYAFVFWAETANTNNGVPYIIDWGKATTGGPTLKYKTSDEVELAATVETSAFNKDDFDAFYSAIEINVTGDLTSTISLTRPFAQLNIGTSDFDASTNGGLATQQTSIVVENVPTALTFFGEAGQADVNGIINYTATTNTPKAIAYSYSDIPTSGVVGTFDAVQTATDYTFPYITETAGTGEPAQTTKYTYYKYLGMQYILAPSTQMTATKVTVKFMDANGVQDDASNLVANNVPLRRNYRTNIYGTLLTNTTNFNVIISPNFIGGWNQDRTDEIKNGQTWEGSKNGEPETYN